MFFQELTSFLTLAAPAFPRFGADVSVLALLFLSWGALSDLVSGKIPNASVFGGAVVLGLVLLVDATWIVIGRQIGFALLLWASLWAANELFVKLKGYDALGMGDVKWSALAAIAFGIEPVYIAWIVGAWLALLWLGLRRFLVWKSILKAETADTIGVPVSYVHFAPFLFIGLVCGLAWRVYS